MMNQVLVVGKLIEIRKEKIKVEVKRPYKDEEGIYVSDVIPVILNGYLNSSLKDYCKVGDVIGVKGMIRNDNKKIVVYAEKVTFLSTKKEGEENV